MPMYRSDSSRPRQSIQRMDPPTPNPVIHPSIMPGPIPMPGTGAAMPGVLGAMGQQEIDALQRQLTGGLLRDNRERDLMGVLKSTAQTPQSQAERDIQGHLLNGMADNPFSGLKPEHRAKVKTRPAAFLRAIGTTK